MLFNSFAYAVFLPCVFLLYWTLPDKCRWVLLLVSSYYFYMRWNAKYALLIAGTTLVSYLCALFIEKTDRVLWKKALVFLAVSVSLAVLYVFKYFNFSMDLLARFFPVSPARLNFLLPVGISFYTFQTLSYVIDVYKGGGKTERHLGVYAAFVAFFPQLVAGPIERADNLMPQIRKGRAFDYGAACYGVRLILWGLYKKMVVADNLAVWVDRVYGGVASFSGFSLFLATVFFSIQIYCDFSGYSDIARGSAKLLNIDLVENFKSPYFSASIREFWSRWHISLSTWFRDYVYIPMGGNRVSKSRNICNTLATFLVSGLWHGAGLTYLVWGGVHGAGQVYENAFGVQKCRARDIYWWLRVACIFGFATFAWVFFRAANVHDAWYVLRNMFSGAGSGKAYVIAGLGALGIGKSTAWKILVLYCLPVFLYDYLSLERDICLWMGRQHAAARYAYVIGMAVLILVFGYAGQSSFVYFQF